MKIDKNRLKLGIWYEGKNGEYIPYDGANFDPPKDAYTYHASFPLEVSEKIYIVRDENGKIVDKPFNERHLMTGTSSIGRCTCDVILAMANSGDYTLPEAIAVYSNACERCMNVLTYKYLNGKRGYPEYSEQWERCGTVCDFCREDEHNGYSR